MNRVIQIYRFLTILTTLSTLLNCILFAQTTPVVGRVVDAVSLTPVSGLDVYVYTSENGANKSADHDTTDEDGRFRIYPTITNVRQENSEVPSNYKISSAYPNPTSGISSVEFTVPTENRVSIKVYDILGRECFTQKHNVTSGRWSMDVDLSKLSSGIYFISIFSNGKFVGSSKLILDKTAQSKISYSTSLRKVSELTSAASSNKTSSTRFIDSIKVSGANYKTSVLHNLGYLEGDSVDVGDVAMFSSLAAANVFVYDLKFWREKELHPLVGAIVRLGQDSIITDASGRGSFIVPATSVPYDIKITHPDMFTRETKVIVDNDKNLEFDVLTHSSYPDSIYNFMHGNFGANSGWDPAKPFISAHWVKQPDFIFKVDTTLSSPNDSIASWMQLINYNLMKLDSFMIKASENPEDLEGFLKDYKWKIDKDAWYYDTTSGLHNNGKFVVFWDDSVRLKYGGLAFTGAYLNYETGEIYAAETMYDSFKYIGDGYPVWLNVDRITIHELDTGIYKTGRRTDIASVSNSGPPYEVRNYTENDYPIRLYLLARPPGTVAPDKDNGWHEYENSFQKESRNLMMSYTFTMEDGRTLHYEEKIDDPSKLTSFDKMSEARIREIISRAR